MNIIAMNRHLDWSEAEWRDL